MQGTLLLTHCHKAHRFSCFAVFVLAQVHYIAQAIHPARYTCESTDAFARSLHLSLGVIDL